MLCAVELHMIQLQVAQRRDRVAGEAQTMSTDAAVSAKLQHAVALHHWIVRFRALAGEAHNAVIIRDKGGLPELLAILKQQLLACLERHVF